MTNQSKQANKRAYQLYHDKNNFILKVTPLHKVFSNYPFINSHLENQPQNYIYYYNSKYYFSLSRKALVQKARELKEEWIGEAEGLVREAENKLQLYKNIKF